MPAGQITELLRSAEAELVPMVCEYPRHARVAAPRFAARYGGEGVAGIPGFSPETVQRDWRFAETWSSREMGKHNDAD